jgi:hypothetical protein
MCRTWLQTRFQAQRLLPVGVSPKSCWGCRKAHDASGLNNPEALEERVRSLGEWFHNLHLGDRTNGAGPQELDNRLQRRLLLS